MATRCSSALIVRRRLAWCTPLAAAVVLVASACSDSNDSSSAKSGSTTTTASPAASTTTPATAPAAAASQGQTVTMLAAGDIADCDSKGDEGTAALLDARPNGTIITLGDLAYDKGTASEFENCYGPTWGRHKNRTKPAPGNHEYNTPGAEGYYGYWGPVAGDPAKGYYSYDLGAWHVIAINSNCGDVSCAAGSPQEEWLRADLAAHPAACTAAYWHHPRFSSGSDHGSAPKMAPIWDALYQGGADLVLTGHEHNYERFAPLNPAGEVDEARGIRSIVVGTGGKSHYGFGPPLLGSEVRNGDTFGILDLTLKPNGYDWQFVPQAGFSFTDSGSGTCH